MNKEKLCGYCMIMIGATMIFSIFTATATVIVWLIGWATWYAPLIAVPAAVVINLLGYGLDKRLSK